MKQITEQKFDFFNDGGHGWMKIKIKTLEKLGIADMVSNCSYMRNDTAYLEEDADVSLFCNAIRKIDPAWQLNGHTREHVSDYSSIRRYDNYDYKKYVTMKKIMSRFDDDMTYRKYVIRVVITKSESTHIDYEHLVENKWKLQSKNFKKWVLYLYSNLDSFIISFIQNQIKYLSQYNTSELISEKIKQLEIDFIYFLKLGDA